MLEVNQLIGFDYVPPVASVSFVASAADTVPASTINGDFIVVLKLNALPTGYTRIRTTVGNFATDLSWKISDGTDAGTNLNDGNPAVIAVFRGNTIISSASIIDVENDSGASDPPAQVISSGSGVTPLIAFGSYGEFGGGTVSPRTMTPAKDGEQNNGTNAYWIAWKIYNSSPADVTVDMEDEGNNDLTSFFVQFF